MYYKFDTGVAPEIATGLQAENNIYNRPFTINGVQGKMKTAKNMVADKGRKIVSVPVGTTLLTTLETMNEKKVGAILVTRGEKIIGIWDRKRPHAGYHSGRLGSEKCIDRRLHDDQSDIKRPTPIRSLTSWTNFWGLRVRHLLIEEDGRTIGLVSGGDVMKCVIHEKDAELKQLNSMVSWDYYEDWKWKPEDL